MGRLDELDLPLTLKRSEEGRRLEAAGRRRELEMSTE
jgi:hypothetical protein